MNIVTSRPAHTNEIVEVHFYDPNGRLVDVHKSGMNGDLDFEGVLKAILALTDAHGLVHIDQRGQIVEVCATANKE